MHPGFFSVLGGLHWIEQCDPLQPCHSLLAHSTPMVFGKQVLSLLAAGSRTNQAGFVLSKFRWQIRG